MFFDSLKTLFITVSTMQNIYTINSSIAPLLTLLEFIVSKNDNATIVDIHTQKRYTSKEAVRIIKLKKL